MTVLFVIYIALAIIGLKIKVSRTQMPKLSKFLNWFIIIAFGIAYCIKAIYNLNGNPELYGSYAMSTLAYEFSVIFTMRTYAIIELIILLVLNILTISEKGKAIFLSIAQVATSFIVPLAILFILFGGLGGSAPSSTSDSTGYSYDHNTEARNKGYSNALDAERSGRKWNGSTWE